VAHTLALKPSSFSRNGLIQEHSSNINNKTKKDITLARHRLLSHSNLRPFISPRNFVLGFILDLDRGYTRPYFSWNHHSPHNLLDAKRSSHVFAKSFIYKGMLLLYSSSNKLHPSLFNILYKSICSLLKNRIQFSDI